MSDSLPKVEVRGLTKRFQRGEQEIYAVKDISLQVRDGEFVALVGASGCGKTTLLRLIDGLITPTSGTVEVDGRPVTRPGPDRGFVFQQDCLFPWRNTSSNAWLGPELLGLPAQKSQSLRERFIKLVGLHDFRSNYPHELSGGMRQRVNIARALTIDPEVLLMDEPFASLDAQTREIMQSGLLRVWNQARKTVLFVTHAIDEAVYLSDRVLVFTARPGRLKESVTIDLPRPRALSIKRTPEFAQYVDHIWRLIEEEVRASMNWDDTAELEAQSV